MNIGVRVLGISLRNQRGTQQILCMAWTGLPAGQRISGQSAEHACGGAAVWSDSALAQAA